LYASLQTFGTVLGIAMVALPYVLQFWCRDPPNYQDTFKQIVRASLGLILIGGAYIGQLCSGVDGMHV
jgi:hypothetical protein